MTPESAGLRHLFHSITALKKDNGPGTEGVKAPEIKQVGILGAGLMGHGIAYLLAAAGHQVAVFEPSPEIRASLATGPRRSPARC